MYKQNLTGYLLFISLLFIIGCSNDSIPPPDTTNNTVFEISATIDGVQKEWKAGIDNQYMYPFTTTDSNDIVHFQGNMGLSNCQNCQNSINFDFVQVQNNTSINTLFNNNITFRNSVVNIDTIDFSTKFELDLNGTPPYNINWDFGDGTTLINSNNIIIQHQYNISGNYDVCVEIIDATGCENTICQNISMDNTLKCAINFTPYIDNNFPNTFLYYSYSTGIPPFSYQWEIPIEITTTQNFTIASPTVFVNQLISGVASIDMIDNDGCTCSAEQTVDYQNINNTCTHFLTYNTEPNINIGDLSDYFSTLTIQFIDDNDIVYSSALGEQPNTSFINIVNIEDFEKSIDNLDTKKIELNFTCRLFDANGNYKNMSNGSATIAVAYE